MGNFNLVKCENDTCDFWQDGNCFYGGVLEIKPNVNQGDQCKAFEPFYEEEEK